MTQRLSCIAAGSSGFLYGSNDNQPSYASIRRTSFRIRKPDVSIEYHGFRDRSHLEFYSRAGPCLCNKEDGLFTIQRDEKRMKQTKKKLKLLERMCGDLRTLSQEGFDPDLDVISSEVMVVLMNRLEQLRTEEREYARKKKEMKNKEKRYLDGKMMMAGCDSSSSSSESSDSDTECCERMVDSKSLKSVYVIDNPKQLGDGAEVPAVKNMEVISGTLNERQCAQNEINEMTNAMTDNSRRIEVCMGNKCTKSGGVALLEELDKATGAAGAVVGSKCMGKCKNGPNVRVFNQYSQAGSMLCVGVNMDDVDTIANNCFNQKFFNTV